jgi:hypothetical protein
MTTEYAKGDRVSYTVMYGAGPGQHRDQTEYGTVTRVKPGGARGEPQATIAVENPQPGRAKYVTRYVATIAPAPLDAGAKTEYHYLYRNAHEHKSPDGGQTTRHSHEGGNATHSYYGHAEDARGMAGKHGDDMSVCPGPCPSHDPYTPHPAEPAYMRDTAHVHCGVSGHTDPGEDELPKGWQVFYDGELVFGRADAGKWADIGPTIMTATDGTPEPAYTREQVVAAINDAANVTGKLMHGEEDGESSKTIAADDAMNMVVNVAGYLLDHPGADLDEIILSEYGDARDENETDADLIERVKSWFE